MKRLAAVLLAVLAITGCNAMKPEDFAHSTPRFLLEEYFDGRTQAWGIFEDRFGTVRRQFTVDITGRREGDALVLDEDFIYSDGERDRRVWRIVKTGDHGYEGRADDVIGVAAGKAYGNAVNWRYAMDLAVGEGTWRVRFDDWMFLQPGGVVINRAAVTKWGLEIGRVTLVFTKPVRPAATVTGWPMHASG
jgi:hypothetical protein